MGVSAGGAYHKTWRYSLRKVRCCCLKYCVVSKEGYVIYGKKSQNEGSFRSVRTSDDVENCFRVKISTSYE